MHEYAASFIVYEPVVHRRASITAHQGKEESCWCWMNVREKSEDGMNQGERKGKEEGMQY